MNSKNYKLVTGLTALTNELKAVLEKQELEIKEAKLERDKMTGDQEAALIIKMLRNYFDKYSYLNVHAEVNTNDIKTWDDFLNKMHNHITY